MALRGTYYQNAKIQVIFHTDFPLLLFNPMSVMKSSNLLFVIIVLLTSCTAQRVDLDKHSFTASYRELPRRTIDSSYRTFSVATEFSPSVTRHLSDTRPEEYIDIAGWKRLSSGAHVNVQTRMEDVMIANTEVKERQQPVKDKDGKETGKRTYYYVLIEYTFAADARVTDFKGNVLVNWELADRSTKHTYKSEEFSNAVEAAYFIRYNLLNLTSNITRIAAERALNQLNYNLTWDFGYAERYVSDYLWILDSKRHPEYKDYKQAWSSFKQAMFRMRADEPLDEVKKMLEPVISYFEKMKKYYSAESKGDRKMRYASYFNLSKIYYYLDDPDGALREASQLMVNDYDEKDGRALEAAAADLKHIMRLNKINSRHFAVNIESFKGPETEVSKK
jgi:hypothetical protein